MAHFFNFFFEDLRLRMRIHLRLLTILFLLSVTSVAQESLPYRKNAITINITRLLVNEYNFGIERFFSQRRSMEIDVGIIHPSEYWQDVAADFTEDPLFYEEGYALRVHIKTWKKTENSKWRNYSGPGITYKHTFYEDYPMTVTKTNPSVKPGHGQYVETMSQDRVRDKFGLEYIWGNVFEASRTFAFEIYYGAGLTVASVKRTDHDRFATYQDSNEQWRNQALPTFIDYSVYFRPILQAGFKMVIRL
jgi:hypothetical protein